MLFLVQFLLQSLNHGFIELYHLHDVKHGRLLLVLILHPLNDHPELVAQGPRYHLLRTMAVQIHLAHVRVNLLVERPPLDELVQAGWCQAEDQCQKLLVDLGVNSIELLKIFLKMFLRF